VLHPHSTSHTPSRSRTTIVPRINALCGHQSLLRHTPELQRTYTDLNTLISKTLIGLKTPSGHHASRDFTLYRAPP